MNSKENSVGRWLRHPGVRAVLLTITFAYRVGRRRMRSEMRTSAASLSVDWRWIALATGIVLLTYALIQSWRLLLAGWGGVLPYAAART